MPTEIRRVIFTWTEIGAALTNFIQNHRTGIEPGTVLGAEIANQQPLTVRAQVQSKSGRLTNEVFEEAFVAAALIAWCIKEKIPLPRSSSKAVRLTRDGQVTLDTTLT